MSQLRTIGWIVAFLGTLSFAAAYAEHEQGGSVPGETRQVVRSELTTVVKEVFPSSIRMQFIETGADKPRTSTFNMTDFTDDKRNGKGDTAKFLFAAVKGKEKEAVAAAKRLGFTVRDEDGFFIATFSKKDPPYAKIQSLFMSPTVLYVEPNAKRGID